MSLPSGYKRLEYIQSSGTQYIDSGLVMNKSDSYEYMLTGYFSNNAYGGANGYMQFLSGIAINAKSTIKVVYDGKTYDERVYVNGTLNSSNNWSNYNGVNVKIGIFKLGDINNGWFSGEAQIGKLYSLRIKNADTIVRDFIPCINPSGVVGLYDLVEKQFYGNAGAGTFTAGAEVDPYGNDESTLLLLHGEDLTDSSPYNKSITNNGASISSAQSKFGGASLYFNGEDAFMTVDLPVSGNCTVDFWIFALSYESSNSKYPTPIDYQGNSGLRGLYVHTNSSVTYYGASTPSQSAGHHFSADKLPLNEWHHIAVVREGTTVKCYLDGVLQGTLTGCYTLNDVLFIGNVNAGDYPFHGYLDEIRVSSIARWREDFTPPSKPYSSSLNLPVNIGGTWKDANEVFVNISGTWKTVEAAFVNIGGTWKELG